MSDRRIIVAVDLDEVLGQFVAALATWHNTKFDTIHSVADYSSYHFADVWKCTDEQASERVWEFFSSENFVRLEPIDGAADALRALQDKFRFIVVTSRQLAIESQTRDWISMHFGGIFEDVLLANHYSKSGEQKSKLELCQSVGAKVLIDDSPKYVGECGGKLPTTILFGDYAWNRRSDEGPLPSGVHRAHNWGQLKSLMYRVSRDGTVGDKDSVVVTMRLKPDVYMNTVRWVLENQEAVNVTATSAAIASATRCVDSLERAGDVTVLSIRTGMDAAAPGKDRMPRLTARVQRTPALLAKLVKVANETPRYRAARSTLDAARHSTEPVDLSPDAPVIGNGKGYTCGPAAQASMQGSMAGALLGAAAAAAGEPAQQAAV